MFSNIPFKRVNWVNSSFLMGTTLVALIGIPIYLYNYGWSYMDGLQWGMFAFYMIATGLSITMGYHRLFSHLSFKAKWPVKLFTLIFGACAFENTAIDWSSDHRKHHKHVDHDDDPYDISKGFMWAHIGWIMFKLNPEPPIDNVKDLQSDRLCQWQYKWYVPLSVGVGLILPALIGYLAAGGPGAWAGFLFAGVLRVILVQHSTFFINSLCHTLGKQPYSSKCSARDSALMAVLTYGEGYHNYHHEFQHDYRNGIKPWQWDPTKWTIWTLSKIGLTSNLRRVDDKKIIRAEMTQAQMQAAERLRALESQPGVCETSLAKLKELNKQLSDNLAQLEQAMKDRIEISKQKLNDLERETRELLAQVRSFKAGPIKH